MVWTISKCNRVLRPIQGQVGRYRTIHKLYPQEVDELVEYQPRSVYTPEDCLDNCRRTLSTQCYERCLGLYSSFEQLLLQFPTGVTNNLKLTQRSAIRIGEYIAGRESEDECADDHHEIDAILDDSNGICARQRNYVCLGQALGMLSKHAYTIRQVIPALAMYCIEQEHLFIARRLFAIYCESIPEREFLARRELIVRLAHRLDMNKCVFDRTLKLELEENEFPELFCILDNLALDSLPVPVIENVTLHVLALVRRNQHCHDSANFAVQMLQIYFARCGSLCSAPQWKTVLLFLKKIPITRTYTAIRKALQLYVNFKRQNRWLNISPEDNISDLSRLIVGFYKHCADFATFMEYILPAAPALAVAASSKFVLCSNNPDMKLVLWQDKLAARAAQQCADEDDIFDATMGVWITPPESPKMLQSSRRTYGEMSEDDDEDVRSSDAEDDDISLIRRQPQKRRRSSGRQLSHAFINDDINLISVR